MPDWFDPVTTHRPAKARAPLPGSADRRSLILDAALTVIARDGPARLTMRNVASEARVALGLANYYFATKADLLLAVAVEWQRRRTAGDPDPGAPGRDLEAGCRELASSRRRC